MSEYVPSFFLLHRLSWYCPSATTEIGQNIKDDSDLLVVRVETHRIRMLCSCMKVTWPITTCTWKSRSLSRISKSWSTIM